MVSLFLCLSGSFSVPSGSFFCACKGLKSFNMKLFYHSSDKFLTNEVSICYTIIPMDYTTLLNLKKEPFSISPDPGFFYYSKDYQECLQKLELSIRLRRGLNIILGDVGTGKTTLSRALIQLFQGYEEFRFHLILDPSFNSEYEFLLTLIKIFNIPVPEEKTILAFKEAIRTNLLREGLEKKRVVVLIIDETQKMDYPFLELLRDFLNFETNEYKLLQLVLLGQMEFLEKIKGKKNFMDRVNMIYFLKPLSLADTREMIEFRLRKAGYFSKEPLFTKDAYRKIHDYSHGFSPKDCQPLPSLPAADAHQKAAHRGQAVSRRGCQISLSRRHLSRAEED